MDVVVVGGGLAGAEFVRHASKLPVNITLIEPKDYMVCQALLPELLSGKVEEEEVLVDLKEFCSRVGVEFVKDRAERVEEGFVITRGGKEVEYDVLVVAVGAETNHLEGAEEVNTLEGVVRAKRALNDAERVIVVGSGITGVETALELSEMGYEVSVVEGTGRILPSFSLKVSNFVYKILMKEGVDVRTSAMVVRVDEDGVVTGRGKVFGDVVIWCAGLRPSSFLECLDVPKERGWVRVDPFLRANSLFAVGDCAHVEVRGKVATKTVLEAEMQARHVARNLERMLKGCRLAEYRVRSSLEEPIAMITLARNRAILVYKGVAITRPMKAIYWIKKMAVRRFLRSFCP